MTPTQQEVHRTQQKQNLDFQNGDNEQRKLLKSCGDLEKFLFPDANGVLRG